LTITGKGLAGAAVACLVLVLGALPATAQQRAKRPLFDSITIGPGLAFYSGDFDANPSNNTLQFLASSGFNFLIAGERRSANLSTGIHLNYSRIRIQSRTLDVTTSFPSIDFMLGYHVGLIRSDLFQVAAGIGATFVVPQYHDYPTIEEMGELQNFYRRSGARIVLTLPLALSIQERVRVGVRLTRSDYLDSFKGLGTGADMLGFVTVGYRFDFTD
jgi:hypothetical protein